MSSTTARFPYMPTRQATFPLPECHYRNAAKNGFCHRASCDTPEICRLPAITDGDLQLPVIVCDCCSDLQLPVSCSDLQSPVLPVSADGIVISRRF